MFTVISSNRPAGTLTVANLSTDELTEITTYEYFQADKNLEVAVGLAKDRTAREFSRDGGAL